ncbi:BLUF domain-containing protein [Ferrimonas senticii]|uniref:BLUF domain-containing protein n=1 Tax=Ferrimonas senticii TaxID=394566 RepID=UPI000414140A|nr:BLUF domain-containing protein [Ferrimonas senticii]
MLAMVYVSQATALFRPAELDELVDMAALNNSEQQISGCLFFDDDRFFQYIEGPATAVRQLMASIEQDPRHRILTLFEQPQLEQRRFPSWQMQRISCSQLQQLWGDLQHSGAPALLTQTFTDPKLWQTKLFRDIDQLAHAYQQQLNPHHHWR